MRSPEILKAKIRKPTPNKLCLLKQIVNVNKDISFHNKENETSYMLLFILFISVLVPGEIAMQLARLLLLTFFKQFGWAFLELQRLNDAKHQDAGPWNQFIYLDKIFKIQKKTLMTLLNCTHFYNS